MPLFINGKILFKKNNLEFFFNTFIYGKKIAKLEKYFSILEKYSSKMAAKLKYFFKMKKYFSKK
jgi:hypothetical protein